MSRIVKADGYWEHHDDAGNVTIVERDAHGYFVPGFYGEGVPRFRTLGVTQAYIDAVKRAVGLPENWDTWISMPFFRMWEV